MNHDRDISLACSRASRAFQTLGNALIICGDGAKFASAASIALSFESAIDASDDVRRDLVSEARAFVPVAIDAIEPRFSRGASQLLAVRLMRAIDNFSRKTTI